MLWKGSGPTIQALVFLACLPLTSCVTLGSSFNLSEGRREVEATGPSDERRRETSLVPGTCFPHDTDF